MKAPLAIPMCPHCGYDFDKDKPIWNNEWLLTPFSCLWNGIPVELTSQQYSVLYAIGKSGKTPIGPDALLNRTSESYRTNLVHVVIYSLRRKLPTLPIETVRGRGYRWAGEPLS